MFLEDGVEQEDRNESLKALKLVLLHDRALWHGRHHNIKTAFELQNYSFVSALATNRSIAQY